MSRNNKQRRHEKQQKQQKRRRREAMIRGTAAPRWIAVCEQAVTLLKCRSWDEAREVLEQYEWEHPGQREVLRLLLDVYHEQGDYVPYCRTCRRLLEKEPDNLNLHLMLAGGYWNDARLASALRAFRRFVELWPDDPLADGAREGIEQLEPAVEELLHGLPFAGEERLELAAMHEEVMASLAAGDCERTIRIGEQLLARSPDFAPTMNNLSEAYFRLGHADKAIDISRRVLQQHPDDFHALSNLTRYQFLSGRQDEARELAEQLRSVRSERDDLWYKQCEALSFLGDDDAVLACFAEAERAGVTRQQTPAEALLYHLAAVALARQGQQRQATRYWRQALKIQPGLKLAKENLADAAQRIGQRHGPWCFSLSSWIREELIDNLCASLDRQARRKSDETGERAV
ncbi:MAG TPA: tetratricopeptide repeat protein, partial [Pirellulales bacterium]